METEKYNAPWKNNIMLNVCSRERMLEAMQFVQDCNGGSIRLEGTKFVLTIRPGISNKVFTRCLKKVEKSPQYLWR